MSISDRIIVMKEGVIQQIGKPQDVYDQPVNLFVAKFLGTPPINVFSGEVRDGAVYIGEDRLFAADKLPAGPLTIGIRPEGFVLKEDGPLRCALTRVEVMGRDVSVVAANPAAETPTIRAIISAEELPRLNGQEVRFAVKPAKIFLFDNATGARIPFDAED